MICTETAEWLSLDCESCYIQCLAVQCTHTEYKAYHCHHKTEVDFGGFSGEGEENKDCLTIELLIPGIF